MRFLPKRVVFSALIVLMAAFGLSCANEHQGFCKSAAQELCAKCASCSPDGMRHCGMMDKQDLSACARDYVAVCKATDDVFNFELSRTCLDRIERTNCAQIRKEGKPDVCNRLF